MLLLIASNMRFTSTHPFLLFTSLNFLKLSALRCKPLVTCRFWGWGGGSPNKRPWSLSHDGLMSLGFGPRCSFPPSKSRFEFISFSLAPGDSAVRSLSFWSGVSAVCCSLRLSKIEFCLEIVIRLWSVRPVRCLGRFDMETLSILPGLWWPEDLFVRYC